ncbi:MAG TPA: DUF2510 domain-containing protein [Acidimicrobiales bacterium]
MSHVVTSGWYGDPGHKHESRYWDGSRWTAKVADHGTLSEDEAGVDRFGPPGSGDRLALWSLVLLFVGGAMALAASVVWGEWMKISSTLSTEDRVWGWTAFWRGLPTAIIAWSVPIIAMLLAVRACRRGSTSLGRAAIVLGGIVLLIVSISLISGMVESARSDSEQALKWLLFPVSVALAGCGTFVALRAAKRQTA